MSGFRRLAMVMAAVLFGTVGSVRAQDVMQVAAQHYKVKVENAHVRVVENTLAPGEKDAMHTHPAGWFYVTKPGSMKIVFANGKTDTWEAREGESGWMNAEGPHTSENIGTTTLAYVLVEVKSAAVPVAAKPPAEKP